MGRAARSSVGGASSAAAALLHQLDQVAASETPPPPARLARAAGWSSRSRPCALSQPTRALRRGPTPGRRPHPAGSAPQWELADNVHTSRPGPVLGDDDGLLRQAHLLHEGGRRHPGGRLPSEPRSRGRQRSRRIPRPCRSGRAKRLALMAPVARLAADRAFPPLLRRAAWASTMPGAGAWELEEFLRRRALLGPARGVARLQTLRAGQELRHDASSSAMRFCRKRFGAVSVNALRRRQPGTFCCLGILPRPPPYPIAEGKCIRSSRNVNGYRRTMRNEATLYAGVAERLP